MSFSFTEHCQKNKQSTQTKPPPQQQQQKPSEQFSEISVLLLAQYMSRNSNELRANITGTWIVFWVYCKTVWI